MYDIFPEDFFPCQRKLSPRLAGVPEPHVLELEAHAHILGARGQILGVRGVHDVRRLVQQLRQVADVDESLIGGGGQTISLVWKKARIPKIEGVGSLDLPKKKTF